MIADARHAGRVPDGVELVSEAELVEEADALVSLGGDGTMLARCGSSRTGPSPSSA